jgi:hypothetical protein
MGRGTLGRSYYGVSPKGRDAKQGSFDLPCLRNQKSERISPVKKHIPPLTTSSGYTIVPDVQVLLYGRG